MKRKRPRSALKRWTKRGLVAVGVLVCLIAGFLLWVYLSCFAEPPALDGTPPIVTEEPRAGPEGRVNLGKSWFFRDKGCSLLYLEGDPFTIGYTNAALTTKFMEIQERSLIERAREFLPSPISFAAVCVFVLVNNRNLPEYVPLEYQYEILGLSRGSSDPFPEYGPRYHRVLNYHAAHDIAHLVWDQPVLGCTAFAARRSRTKDGHLLLARNFDFEAGSHFDENKIVGLYRPEKGYVFLSVSWPGMAGAVTGFNEKRLYCSINGAHSDDRRSIGKPVSLVVRELLQYAGSLDEAIRRIEEAPVFVADSYLIADGKTNEAVVVEKSPAKAAVRCMEADRLLQANQFETAEFAEDEANRRYMREGTSLSRHARLGELVEEHSGHLDAPTAVRILRDRRGPGGRQIAPGNRGAINPMIATHAVVVDLTDGILWVSRGPHQLGRFEAFSIETFGSEERAAPAIPADPALASGLYERVKKARGLVAQAEKALAGSESREKALAHLREALALNPEDPSTLRLLGEVLEAAGKRGEALEHFKLALSAAPPFRADREAIKAAIQRLE